MTCAICALHPPTTRKESEPNDACDACLAALGDIRIWLRESGRRDSMAIAINLRSSDLRKKA